MRRLRVAWEALEPTTQAMTIMLLLVASVSAVVVAVLIAWHPDRWAAAVGFGCSFASIMLVVLSFKRARRD